MTIAAVLVAYAVCVGTLGKQAARPGSVGRHGRRCSRSSPIWPPNGLLLPALGLACLTLAVHATALGGGLSHLIGACVLRLRAAYGTPGGATVAGLGLILTGAVAARTVLTAMTHLRAARRQALRHAQAARLAGLSRAGTGGRADGAFRSQSPTASPAGTRR